MTSIFGAQTSKDSRSIPVSASPVGNRNYLDVSSDMVLGINISSGSLSGYDFIHKFGTNKDIDSGTAPEDIWDFGGVYEFTPDTGSVYFISSSDNTDVVDVEIDGLDENFVTKTVTQTLNGSESIELSGSWSRVFRLKNVGSVDLSGSVYVYEPDAVTAGVPDSGNTTVRALISGTNNQTLMAIYTIPSGKTGYLYSYYASVNRGKSGGATREADMSILFRPFGEVFKIKEQFGLSNAATSAYSYNYVVPIRLDEKTDIKFQCPISSADNTNVSAGFDIVLIDN